MSGACRAHAGATAEPPIGARHRRLTSDPHAVRRALAWLRGLLHAWGTAPADVDAAEIVAAEVLNNIAEHAYGGEEGRPIDLWLLADRLGITLCLRDVGGPMPAGGLPVCCPVDPCTMAASDLPEGGWGWGLIGAVATRIVYRRNAGTNHLWVSVRAHAVRCMDTVPPMRLDL